MAQASTTWYVLRRSGCAARACQRLMPGFRHACIVTQVWDMDSLTSLTSTINKEKEAAPWSLKFRDAAAVRGAHALGCRGCCSSLTACCAAGRTRHLQWWLTSPMTAEELKSAVKAAGYKQEDEAAKALARLQELMQTVEEVARSTGARPAGELFPIAFLGHFNSGKTFLINLLTQMDFQSGYLSAQETKGISAMLGGSGMPRYALLDTAGTDRAAIIDDVLTGDERRDAYYKKQCTESFLQRVVFDSAEMYVVVVNDLRRSDQVYLDRVIEKAGEQMVSGSTQRKEVLVIHNLANLRTLKEVKANGTRNIATCIGKGADTDAFDVPMNGIAYVQHQPADASSKDAIGSLGQSPVVADHLLLGDMNTTDPELKAHNKAVVKEIEQRIAKNAKKFTPANTQAATMSLRDRIMGHAKRLLPLYVNYLDKHHRITRPPEGEDAIQLCSTLTRSSADRLMAKVPPKDSNASQAKLASSRRAPSPLGCVPRQNAKTS